MVRSHRHGGADREGRGCPEAPLAGVRVLDMTRLLPGNFATVMLVGDGRRGDQDRGSRGDGTRWVAPHLPSGESGAFVQLNRGRPAGSSTSRRRRRPGGSRRCSPPPTSWWTRSARACSTGRFSRDATATATDLVHVTIDAYGSGGELEQVPGHDLNTIGYAGVLTLAGTPALPGLQVADWPRVCMRRWRCWLVCDRAPGRVRAQRGRDGRCPR